MLLSCAPLSCARGVWFICGDCRSCPAAPGFCAPPPDWPPPGRFWADANATLASNAAVVTKSLLLIGTVLVVLFPAHVRSVKPRTPLSQTTDSLYGSRGGHDARFPP